MSWEEFTVNEVCEAIIDCVNKTATKSDLTTPYKMIRTTNVRNGEIDLENVFNVEKEVYEKWIRRGKPLKNDIILTREAPVGEVGILRVDDTVFLGQRTMMYRAKKSLITPHFLYYSLRSSFVQNQLHSYSSGSTVSHVRVPDAKSFLVKVPNLKTQTRIADILSAYDELIENNRKRIKLLEQAAQNIYKEWFVNLRFPGHENITINEETGLPQGWTKVLAKDWFDFKRGIEVGSKNYVTEASENAIPFLRVGSLGSRDKDVFTNISLVKDKILKFTDVAVSMDGSIGLVGYGLVGAYSTGLRKVVPKNDKYGNGFVFCLLKSEEIQDTIRVYAKGSTILHASSSIDHLSFNNAPNGIANQFNSIIEPIYSQMLTLNKQNSKLKAARDILLPRLMNRTIEV
jgi:type I restriction enzyme, S subunit